MCTIPPDVKIYESAFRKKICPLKSLGEVEQIQIANDKDESILRREIEQIKFEFHKQIKQVRDEKIKSEVEIKKLTFIIEQCSLNKEVLRSDYEKR